MLLSNQDTCRDAALDNEPRVDSPQDLKAALVGRQLAERLETAAEGDVVTLDGCDPEVAEAKLEAPTDPSLPSVARARRPGGPEPAVQIDWSRAKAAGADNDPLGGSADASGRIADPRASRPETGSRTWLGLLLGLPIAGVAVVALAQGRPDPTLEAEYRQAGHELGAAEGADTCVNEAVVMTGQCTELLGGECGALSRVFVEACLAASSGGPAELCTQAPTSNGLLDSWQFARGECSRRGTSGMACAGVLRSVSRWCIAASY